MKTTQSFGGIVLNSQGQVLVVNQNGNSWSLPKGHLEKGETPLEAAKREITEESGLSQLVYIKELGSYNRYKIGPQGRGEDQTELKTITLFLFSTSQKELKPADPHNPQAKWVSKEKVVSLLTHPKDQEFFQQIEKEI